MSSSSPKTVEALAEQALDSLDHLASTRARVAWLRRELDAAERDLQASTSQVLDAMEIDWRAARQLAREGR